ncbi:MAG TPA: NAD(P)-dependent oxidoreductase [Vicinamibacterales bacterium]|nr:NAD(P)-dependent oxidoreductase [Vicinamibacterales bacterium]
MRIAFIGLGNMGRPMARNLLDAGLDLIVFNRTRAHANALAALGAGAAGSAAAAAADADVLITMLSDDQALAQVMDRDGALHALRRGATHVSMSTISVAASRDLADRHAAAGHAYVAAPVFGRPDAAAAKMLFIVAAGPVLAIDRCHPLFDAMGQRTFIVGEDAPLANLVKLSGNFLLASVIESLAEAFALTRKAGVDPLQYLEVLTSTLFGAPVYRSYGGMIARGEYEPAGFRLPLGLKDVTLALAAADASGVPMPIADLVRRRMETAMARGLERADWAVLGRVAAEDAGLHRP